MLVSALLCAIGTISTVAALPKNVRSEYALKERHEAPPAWTRIGVPARDQRIHLSIGLKQSNEGAIESHLMEISDPKHARYGKHMTAQEIQDITRPSEETQELVKAWLADHGIDNHVHNSAQDMIHILIPIEKAEQLLSTSYSTYQHTDGHTLHRTPEWSLPQHLHEHIDVIQPTNSFFQPKPKYKPQLDAQSYALDAYPGAAVSSHGFQNNAAQSVSTACNASFVTPACIRTVYGTFNYQPKAPTQNSVAHTNYLNETSYRSDIFTFLKMFRPGSQAEANTFQNVIINNAYQSQAPYTPAMIAAGQNIEAILDSTQIISITYPTTFSTYSTGGSPPFKPDLATPTDTNEPYLTFLDYVLNQQTLPNVFSTSYGDDEQSVPKSYATKVCSGFAQLGARGISVLFSSGDAGVGGDGTCFSNNGNNIPKFLPAFPASCPYVTAVGATASFQPEVAVSRFASGAGFSNYFPAPAYGNVTWTNYIKSLNGLHNGLYNKKGRGYPDVAAQGNHDAIVYNGTVYTVGGTSASSPTFAGVIALVNDALIFEGKPTLGFLNPWIYGGAYTALTDITSGSSFGCNTTGFPAQTGWDAVTGWGTPNFSKLVEAAFRT